MVTRRVFEAGKVRVRRRVRGAPSSLLAIGLCLAGMMGPGQAQTPGSDASESAEQLTVKLNTLRIQYQTEDPSRRAGLVEGLVTVAAARQQTFAALIENDPTEVLRLAMPHHYRSKLPPAAQTYVEEHVTVEGELEVLHEDGDQGSRYHHYLQTTKGRLSLHFAANPLTLLTGTRLRVKGVRVQQALALRSDSSNVQVLSAPLLNSIGAQKTAVLLVNFQDNPTQPYTAADAQSVVFTTTSNFDLEGSYQQTWLTGEVYGWYTIALSSKVCDYLTLADQAKSAATAAGVNVAGYTRYVYVFPTNACSFWGLGTVGGSPSEAWINGSLELRRVGHEMGHNFGLYHSHAWECGSTTLGTTCNSIEYGDSLDIMGGASGHYNAFQKARLGWLNTGASPPITTVSKSGTYLVDAYEPGGSNPKALKILKDSTSGTWYYVEYRQATGFDSFLTGNSNVLNGVVVHMGSDYDANSSQLLDMTPSGGGGNFDKNQIGPDWLDPALTTGQTFSDPVSGVTLNVPWVSSTAAAVSVSFGSAPCVQATPTVAVAPAESPWVSPGTTVTYTASVTNQDNSGCPATTIDLGAAVPTQWTGVFASPSLTVNPGQTASTTLQVTSPTSEPTGVYTIPLTATNMADPARVGSASATYVISAGSTVTVSTNAPSYSLGTTVRVVATVTDNGSPVQGAAVTFTLKKPDGAASSILTKTGSTGIAKTNYSLRTKDPSVYPPGTYTVTAEARVDGSVIGTATTTFQVQ